MISLLSIFSRLVDTKTAKCFSHINQDVIDVQQKDDLQSNYPDFSLQDSYVRTYLTPGMYEDFSAKVTPLGCTIDRCMQIACEKIKKERTIGLVAGDEYCYELFRDLFDPIISERYGGMNMENYSPKSDMDITKLQLDGVLDETYVKSVRVRTGRNIQGFRMSSSISCRERRQTERIITSALNSLQGDLAGAYFPLMKMTTEEEEQLRMDHYLFQAPKSPILVHTGAARNWPTNRGIWYNKDKTFLSWINEEDHCRIISMQNGGDMRAVFDRFCRGFKAFEKNVKESGHDFQWNDRLGYLTLCPSNVGTGFRCSVHLQLRHLGKHPEFRKICYKMGMSKRPTHGNYSEVIDDIYAVANKDRMKKTEVEFVQSVVDATKYLIQLEKHLEEGGQIEDIAPPKHLLRDSSWMQN